MLEHSWPCECPVLGHVPDKHCADGVLLRVTNESSRTLPYLRDTARCGLERVGEHRLDRIDDHDARRFARQHVEHRLHPRFHEQSNAIGDHSNPHRTTGDLPYRLLAGHVQGGGTTTREPRQNLEQQRRLADSGLSADEDDRPRHQTAAKHPVELCQLRPDSLVRGKVHVRCLGGSDR